MKSITKLLLGLSFIVLPFIATAEMTPLDESWIETAYQGSLNLSLFNVPNGSGNPLTQAYDSNGNLVDATITLYLRDNNNNPITNFPREDLWIDATDGGMAPCIGGTIANTDTDANGTTTWSSALLAGGYSMDRIHVWISGSLLNDSAGIQMYTNSPDINGDLVVNLADLTILSTDFFSPPYQYNYRSDFHYDGVINLADIGKFATAVGAHCP